jgi:hypothetical protein
MKVYRLLFKFDYNNGNFEYEDYLEGEFYKTKQAAQNAGLKAQQYWGETGVKYVFKTRAEYIHIND